MTKGKGKKKNSEYDEQLRLAKEIFGVILVAIGVLFGICVFSSSATVVLSALRSFAFGLMGALGYLFPFIIAAWGFITIFAEKLKVKAGTAAAAIIGVIAIISLIHLLSAYGTKTEGGFLSYISMAYNKGCENTAGGGVFGALLAFPAAQFMGKTAGVVVFIAVILICIMLVFSISLRKVGRKVGTKVKEGAHIAAEKIREEKPVREERLREKVEQEAFTYESEPEDEQYPKGTAFNEVLEEDEPAYEEDEREFEYEYEQDEEYEEYEEDERDEEEEEESYPFDNPPEYELDDDGIIDGSYDEDSSELDLGGLRIIDRAHGRKTSAPPVTAKSKKKSFDFTVDEGEETEQIEEPFDYGYEEEPFEEQQPAETMAEEEFEEPEKAAPVRKIKTVAAEPVKTAKPKEKRFKLPSPELLERVKTTATDGQSVKNEIDEYARRLEDTFESFGVDIRVVNASRGPKVTRYELQPAAGVKIAKIKALGDDIALNMAAESVRIEAPIPGKSVIGIELPNKTYASVGVRELIDCKEFTSFEGELPFALGKDIAGKKIYDDLAKMPHLLVAGTTGSGKSVCLNTIIMSLIYRLTPAELQFIMIDPKMVEMAVYNGIPNLKVPVVMDKGKAAGALVWAVAEMERRYKSFQQSGVRNIKSYNRKMKENGEETMAKLVIVIDEFADLMMVSAKDVEDAVCRIAQLGRAAGIHLIIATQSPRADIFTGLIKANVPSRIALTVGNALESRIIMDEQGAEKLLGYGDMLYRPVGKNKATRVQGCFVSDDEIFRVTEYLKEQADAEYDSDVENEMTRIAEQAGKNKQEASSSNDMDADADELLPQAIKTVLEFEQASASMLQRKMRVGYSRAARLMDQLEDLGAVGPSEGSKGRQILWTWADYNERYGGEEDRFGEDEYDYED